MAFDRRRIYRRLVRFESNQTGMKFYAFDSMRIYWTHVRSDSNRRASNFATFDSMRICRSYVRFDSNLQRPYSTRTPGLGVRFDRFVRCPSLVPRALLAMVRHYPTNLPSFNRLRGKYASAMTCGMAVTHSPVAVFVVATH